MEYTSNILEIGSLIKLEDGLTVDKVTNNVGIGTDNPSQKLEIAEAAQQGTTPPTIRITNTTTTYGSTATIGVSHGTIEFYQQETSGNYPAVSAAIMSINEDDYAIAHGLGFFTNNNALTPSEQMRITSTGNVGIGTTNPSYPLHVANSGIYHITAQQTKTDTADTTAYATFYAINNAGTSQVRGYLGAGGASVGNTTMRNHVYVGAQTNHGLRLFTNDLARVTVDTSGNVGIGTTSPSRILTVSAPSGDTLLRTNAVTGSYAGLELTENNSTTSGQYWQINKVPTSHRLQFWNGSERLTVLSGGNVGIGTTSPNASLHIEKNGDQASSVKGITLSSGAAGVNKYLPAIVWSYGANGTPDFAKLEVQRGAGTSGRMLFSVANSSGTMFEAARINESGNVGIGTTSPTTILNLKRTIDTHQLNSSINRILIENPSTSFGGSASGIEFDAGAGDVNAIIAVGADGNNNTPQGLVIKTVTDSPIFFATNSGADFIDTTGVYGEKMRIEANGNVGIGTTSPSQKLHVVGTGLFTDFVRFNGLTAPDFPVDIDSVDGGKALRATRGTSIFRIDQSNDGPGYIGMQSDDDLSIQTNNTSKIYITSAGNVGIGTTSPTFKLHTVLTNATLGQVIARFTQDNSLNDPSLSINSTTTGMEIRTSFSTGIAGSFGLVATGGSSFMTLGTAGTEKVRITSGGNVGIGTTSPAYKLDVTGSARVNSTSNLAMFVKTNSAFGAAISYEDSTTGGNDVISAGAIGGDFYISTNYSERVRVTSAGNVGIGTTAPQQLLHVLGATNGYAMIQGANDSGQAGIYFKKEDTTGTMDRTKGLIVFHTNVGSGWGRGHLGFCLNSAESNTVVSVSDEKFRMVDNGDFLADGDVVAYSTTISDARYKTNIQPIESALDKVNQMRGVSFDWTAVRSGREFGVIAQEIEQIAPEVVSEKELLNGDTMKTVSYTSLVPFLIESIKELTQQVNELKAQLDGLTK